MFDTMTLTKTLGALCGSLLVFLIVSWAATGIFAVGTPHGEGHEQAYAIDTGAEEEVVAEGAVEGVVEASFTEVYASADAAAGEKLFNQCKACHKMDGSNGTGPYLNGVVGRAVGAVEGFAYSTAMAGHGGAWTPEELSNFIANPKDYIEGTKMGYAGMKKIEDRANIVAWLEAQN